VGHEFVVGVRGVAPQSHQHAEGQQGVGAGSAHDLPEEIARPRAELFPRIHQGDGARQVIGAGGVRAVQIRQPVVHRRAGEAQGLEAGIEDGFAANPFDQQVGGGVVADADHLVGRLPKGEGGADGFVRHPAGAPADHFLGHREAFVPTQLAGIEVLKTHQQDRGLDRAGGG